MGVIKKNTILLVEDNELMVTYISNLLINENYEIIITDNKESVFLNIKMFSIDLILLDIGLPDTNGFTICSEFRFPYMGSTSTNTGLILFHQSEFAVATKL